MAERYTAVGRFVMQDGALICACESGRYAESADAVAERVAALLNADFRRFCVAVSHEAAARARTHGAVGERTV